MSLIFKTAQIDVQLRNKIAISSVVGEEAGPKTLPDFWGFLHDHIPSCDEVAAQEFL